MKIIAINGSPKAKDSFSGKVIRQIEKILGGQLETYHVVQLSRKETPPETFEAILDADVLLIVFPLYVDSLPAPLIESLNRLESAAREFLKKPVVYGIANCGFIESHQTELSLDMIRHFALRAGFPWGYGLGIGGGPMVSSFGENWNSGPVKTVYNGLVDMCRKMVNKTEGQNMFVRPKFPRFLYKAIIHTIWRREVKRSGVQNLRARPYSK